MGTQKIAPAHYLASLKNITYNNRVAESASSMPGSASLKYIPVEPTLHKYTLKPNCGELFRIKIVWKSEPYVTKEFHRIHNILGTLPLESPSSVRYMQSTQGYFFDLYLKGNIRITLSQYTDEFEEGGYVNVWLEGNIAFQGKMTVNEIVESVNSYYSEENG